MFYDRLQQCCTKIGTTPTALAKELSISTSNVTNWKKGTMPNGEVLIRLSEFLDVSIDYLLTGKEPTPQVISAPVQEQNTSYSSIEIDLLELFNQLPERKQYELIGELKGYIKCMEEITPPSKNAVS